MRKLILTILTILTILILIDFSIAFTVDDPTTPVEALTILDGGNVGIGTSTPNAKLDVSGDINSTGYVDSENLFSTQSLAPSGGNLTITFPDSSSGLCLAFAATISPDEIKAFSFGKGGTLETGSLRIIDGKAAVDIVILNTESIQIQSTNAFCNSNQCNYVVICNGWNLQGTIMGGVT